METILISIMDKEAEKFCEYLKSIGKDASLAITTDNFVNGEPCETSFKAQGVLNYYWDQFQRSKRKTA